MAYYFFPWNICVRIHNYVISFFLSDGWLAVHSQLRLQEMGNYLKNSNKEKSLYKDYCAHWLLPTSLKLLEKQGLLLSLYCSQERLSRNHCSNTVSINSVLYSQLYSIPSRASSHDFVQFLLELFRFLGLYSILHPNSVYTWGSLLFALCLFHICWPLDYDFANHS